MNSPSSSTDDLVPWLRLALSRGVSLREQRRLLEAFGTPQAVLGAAPSSIDAVAERAVARALLAGPAPRVLERTLAWLRVAGHHCITFGDERYPRALREIADPPLVLYAVGRIELLNAPSLAIVGSRNATPAGARIAEELAEALSNAGLTIVSGLALGIDAAAHRGGIAGASSSIAVMGTGIDIIYPRPNEPLAHQLMARGCLVSEFAPGTPPAQENFPRRNRLISGLARGLLVVEAARRSGSLITARSALDQNREVFAVPGSIHSPMSKGCHWLIREGAKLVEEADDVLVELGMAARKPEADDGVSSGPRERDPVLAAMGFGPMSMDEISERCGMEASELASRISRLEMGGRVCSLPGGRFQQLKSRVIE